LADPRRLETSERPVNGLSDRSKMSDRDFCLGSTASRTFISELTHKIVACSGNGKGEIFMVVTEPAVWHFGKVHVYPKVDV